MDCASGRDVRGNISAPAVSKSRPRSYAISDKLVTRRSRSWERPVVDVAPLLYASGSNLTFGIRQAGGLQCALRALPGAVRRILSTSDCLAPEPGLDRNHVHHFVGGTVG